MKRKISNIINLSEIFRFEFMSINKNYISKKQCMIELQFNEVVLKSEWKNKINKLQKPPDDENKDFNQTYI